MGVLARIVRGMRRAGATVGATTSPENAMEHARYAECIDACNACANACDRCTAACLAEEDVKMMARCIALDIDCAQLCRLAVAVMARGGEAAGAICAACADVCERCASECGRHDAGHCQECAAACRRCAELCRQMAEAA